MLPIIRTLLLLLFIPICYAEIYKWTDENGRVHYGERPDNPNTEKVEIKSTAPKPDTGIDSDRKEKQRKLLDAFEEERAEKKQKKAEAEQKKREMERRCAKAKDRLRRLKNAGAYYALDKNGNRYYLEEKHLKNDIAELDKKIRKNC